MVTIHGTVAPGFEAVADAFVDTVQDGGGSAVSVRHRGRSVVDLWQGHADIESKRGWRHDTATVVFSCTKGLVAIAIAQLAQDGRLELDSPMARYWPEFAASGKEGITVREALSHRAGLAAPRADISLETALDWTAITEVLAEQEPLWEPGAAHGYHALTYGWLAGELIRRITGQSVGTYFRSEIAEPLNASAWIGLPDEIRPRVARLASGITISTPPPETDGRQIGRNEAQWMERTMTLGAAFPAQLVVRGEGFDDPNVHRAEVPGAGGIATAAALATIWSATVVETDGVRLLDRRVVEDMTRLQSEGEPVWWYPGPYPRWGTGFMLPSQRREFLSKSSFGHDGAGGQVAFADHAHQVGFAYVTNVLEVHSDDRGDSIVRALRNALADERITERDIPA